ncbi:SAM-dependent methyltransferase [Herbivorax sp. ANBcel31]|uniref:class I SAM-dependent methyltransferase n=1 Tax=Herbivorax sp. ANBcel31 TaxID=3069754 RepID=UPI0027B37107|nr:SAM-dependent methyltransferase [Herbivorax sp. ANBcel31]MDQ2085520.1 SAM-dependent methyltransferase [Herbivorax sp. ANBcel31]
MNKQVINKLKLFLTGLEQRYRDNIDFFKKISFKFKSGNKEFTGNILADKNTLNLKFNTDTQKINIEQLSQKISQYAKDYDNLELTYEERGSTIIIEADHKNVKMKTKDAKKEIDMGKKHHDTPKVSNRDYYIKVGQADELLKEIGILGANNKVKNDMIRKYNQIDHFVELIDDTIKALLEKHESITVLDCGCGKSYLLFVLNYYIREVLKKPCYFIGLDYSESVIEASKKTASNLGYKNMEFKAIDIKNYKAKRNVHLLISLHACNTATDEAIGLAVNNNVEAIAAVPCCQQEILSQYSFKSFNSIIKHGVLKMRMADVLTDGIRAVLLEAMGYKVSVVEYVSPVDTPKNLMIRGYKIQNKNNKILEDYKNLKKMLNIEPTLEKLILF